MSVYKKLWENSSAFSLTDHEAALAEQLQPGADHIIRGEIGAGKTFTIRHYLMSNNIPHEYLTATEIYETHKSDRMINTPDDVQVVVIDNFDVIPAERDFLGPIYEQIETNLDSFDRSIWIVLPDGYDNDWFKTVTSMMTEAVISKKKINMLHRDQLLHSLEQATDSSVSGDKPDPDSRYGYHSILKQSLA